VREAQPSSSPVPGHLRAGINQPSAFLWAAILAGIAALLIAVAVLQYHWTNEVSAASESRIRIDLESSLVTWRFDFYHEFSAICEALQVGPDSGARDTWNDYVQRYSDWSLATSSPDSVESVYRNPDLVQDIYAWEPGGSVPRLRLLNKYTRRVEDSGVPGDLKPLLTRLQERSSSLAVAFRAWQGPGFEEKKVFAGTRNSLTGGSPGPAAVVTGWQFDSEIPALVHPVHHQGLRQTRTKVDSTEAGNPVDWIVVVFDRQILEKRILPQLAESHFAGQNGFRYGLALVKVGENPRLIYASDSNFDAQHPPQADSVMNIFGPPTETVKTGPGPSAQKDWQYEHEFSTPAWFPVIRYASEYAPWLLMAWNRDGPIDSLVTSVRRRNLMIGGIVLLLLAANMTLIVLTSQRAHKLGKLQMDFVASVSHELRTPLAAILSAGENISSGFVDDKRSLLRHHGEIITRKARQLVGLVDQILLFAAAEKGKSHYLMHRLDVAQIIDEALSNIAAEIDAAGFTIDLQVSPGLPPVVGDLPALCQCLQNLISNAIKYSGENRWVGISAELHQGEGKSQEIRIRVRDRGVGISPLELERVFEPFHRSPEVIAAQIRGTGLGLSVAQGIAGAMGGGLSVTSVVKAGSTFTLHLPVAADEPSEVAPSSQQMNA
jgi:two-component system sensor histidine kinase SenX3